MNCWRALPARLVDGDQVLVTVAKVSGSAPREAGACMLVGGADSFDTIGGGHLEWEAIAHARRMLAVDSTTPELRRFPLSASLGQCCGGVVWLLFERIAASEQGAWRQRLAGLEAGHALRRQCGEGKHSDWLPLPLRHSRESGNPVTLLFASAAQSQSHWVPASAGTTASLQAGQSWVFHHTIALPHFPVAIFGAGHVGEAIVRALLPLEAQVRWIDTREDVFPPDLAGRVSCLTTDAPERELAALPAGCFVLVMTHSHAIDLELCAQGLRRDDLAFFGLIGSHAKRTRFEQRLVRRGFDPLRLAKLVCPIGVTGIQSKLPAAIAAAVVAQLLQIRELAVPNESAPNEQQDSATRAPC